MLGEEIFVGIGGRFVVGERKIVEIAWRRVFEGGETIVIRRTKETKKFGDDNEEKSDGNENENEEKDEEQFRIVWSRSNAKMQGDFR